MLLSKIPFEYFLNVVKQENSAVTEIFLLWFLRPDSLNVLLSEADIGVLGILSEPLLFEVVSNVLHSPRLASAEAVEDEEQRLSLLLLDLEISIN